MSWTSRVRRPQVAWRRALAHHGRRTLSDFLIRHTRCSSGSWARSTGRLIEAASRSWRAPRAPGRRCPCCARHSHGCVVESKRYLPRPTRRRPRMTAWSRIGHWSTAAVSRPRSPRRSFSGVGIAGRRVGSAFSAPPWLPTGARSGSARRRGVWTMAGRRCRPGRRSSRWRHRRRCLSSRTPSSRRRRTRWLRKRRLTTASCR
mmetsp:Transcript_28984/g.83128  ORF Transcript_28984/g.83128 Transcript_28984/m.83128 type:complete len:203 (-) Transcript_28984:2195-2803(-)